MNKLELFLFSHQPSMVETADKAGIDGFILDWEDRNRFQRQSIGDSVQAPDNHEDLARVSSLSQRPAWCRINEPGEWTEDEVELAIAHGADLILLPMVRKPEEVEDFLSIVSDRVQTGILVETTEACDCAAQLATLPLNRIYVGLFDLSISRNSDDLFKPLMDGTVERLRNIFHASKFGVGGLTTVDAGSPVSCLELMAHLARLGSDFTFLRNSFKHDIAGKNMQDELAAIHAAWAQLNT